MDLIYYNQKDILECHKIKLYPTISNVGISLSGNNNGIIFKIKEIYAGKVKLYRFMMKKFGDLSIKKVFTSISDAINRNKNGTFDMTTYQNSTMVSKKILFYESKIN